MAIKNVALLFKWWWHFSDENNQLWKKIVCVCNRLDLERPLGVQCNINGGGPWNVICNVWRMDNEIEDVVLNRIRKEVGIGNNTLLWEDIWIS